MRTFISIDMSEAINQEIKKIQNYLPEFFGKKTELDNLHLTLKFLGEVSEEKLEEVKKKLREIEFEKFGVEVKYLGFFDNQKYGVVWLYLDGCDRLQREIDEKLVGLFEKEKRFMSHLTIARVKKIEDKKDFLKNLKKIKVPEISFIVNNFKLKKSVLTSEGPLYETLEEYDLL